MSYSRFTPKVINIGFVIGDTNKCAQLKNHEEIPKILPIVAVLLNRRKMMVKKIYCPKIDHEFKTKWRPNYLSHNNEILQQKIGAQ